MGKLLSVINHIYFVICAHMKYANCLLSIVIHSVMTLTGTVIPPFLLTVCQCPENSIFRSKSNTGHYKKNRD